MTVDVRFSNTSELCLNHVPRRSDDLRSIDAAHPAASRSSAVLSELEILDARTKSLRPFVESHEEP